MWQTFIELVTCVTCNCDEVRNHTWITCSCDGAFVCLAYNTNVLIIFSDDFTILTNERPGIKRTWTPLFLLCQLKHDFTTVFGQATD